MNIDTLRDGAARAGISADKLKQLVNIFGAEIAAQIVAAQTSKELHMKELRTAFKEFGAVPSIPAVEPDQTNNDFWKTGQQQKEAAGRKASGKHPFWGTDI